MRYVFSRARQTRSQVASEPLGKTRPRSQECQVFKSRFCPLFEAHRHPDPPRGASRGRPPLFGKRRKGCDAAVTGVAFVLTVGIGAHSSHRSWGSLAVVPVVEINTRQHGAAASALVSRSRAMPAGGRRSRCRARFTRVSGTTFPLSRAILSHGGYVPGRAPSRNWAMRAVSRRSRSAYKGRTPGPVGPGVLGPC